MEDTIKHLVSPQSIIVIRKTDTNGISKISSVELLPTGTEQSDYLHTAPKTVYKQRKSTGDPKKDAFFIEKDKRRAERHARGLGRINQPNFGVVTEEDIKEPEQQQ